MCTRKNAATATATTDPVKPIIASTDSPEAARAADMAERLRRLRAGAAANILTGPVGIPFQPAATTATTGGIAK